jgi:hypothetical protein
MLKKANIFLIAGVLKLLARGAFFRFKLFAEPKLKVKYQLVVIFSFGWYMILKARLFPRLLLFRRIQFEKSWFMVVDSRRSKLVRAMFRSLARP